MKLPTLRGMFSTLGLTTSAYHVDVTLVKKWTGLDLLTEEQFDSYKAQGTLRDQLGPDKKIHDDFYGFGQPMEQSGIHAMNTILNLLSERGVIYDIETKGENDALFIKLVDNARTFLRQDTWPTMPDAYANSDRLEAAVQAVRKELQLSEVECAL